jgi:hypothetical protein
MWEQNQLDIAEGSSGIGWKAAAAWEIVRGSHPSYRPRYVIQSNPPKSLSHPLRHPIPQPNSTHHIYTQNI